MKSIEEINSREELIAYILNIKENEKKIEREKFNKLSALCNEYGVSTSILRMHQDVSKRVPPVN